MNELLQQTVQLPYAYIRELSRVHLGRTPESVDWTEVQEARFFDESREIRVLANGKAIEISDGVSSEYIDEIRRVLPAFGKTLTKRNYIRYDEDGQAYICATRLLRWEG